MSTTPKPKRRRSSVPPPDANLAPPAPEAPAQGVPLAAQPTAEIPPVAPPIPVTPPTQSTPSSAGSWAPAAPVPMSPPAVPHAPAALHPAAPADYSLVPPSRPRVGGLVWGVIVTVVGLAVTLIGFRRTTVDLDVLAIVALFAVGVILLTGALIAAVRGRAKPAVPPTYPHPR